MKSKEARILMSNDFLNVLVSDNANKNTDLSLYARFVGNWLFQMTAYDENGQAEGIKFEL